MPRPWPGADRRGRPSPIHARRGRGADTGRTAPLSPCPGSHITVAPSSLAHGPRHRRHRPRRPGSGAQEATTCRPWTGPGDPVGVGHRGAQASFGLVEGLDRDEHDLGADGHVLDGQYRSYPARRPSTPGQCTGGGRIVRGGRRLWSHERSGGGDRGGFLGHGGGDHRRCHAPDLPVGPFSRPGGLDHGRARTRPTCRASRFPTAWRPRRRWRRRSRAPRRVHGRALPRVPRRAERPGAFAGDVEAVVSLSKGIEIGTNLRMSQVVAEVLPGAPAGVLTGPNLAREVAQGHPAASVVALADEDMACRVQQLVHTRPSGSTRAPTSSAVRSPGPPRTSWPSPRASVTAWASGTTPAPCSSPGAWPSSAAWA